MSRKSPARPTILPEVLRARLLRIVPFAAAIALALSGPSFAQDPPPEPDPETQADEEGGEQDETEVADEADDEAEDEEPGLCGLDSPGDGAGRVEECPALRLE